MKILVLNAGSSSIKFQLLDMPAARVLAAGLVEKIGEAESRLVLRSGDGSSVAQPQSIADHRKGLECVMSALKSSGAMQDPGELFGIGHRVVHGGEAFREPTLINAQVTAAIRKLIPLAPLHNGPNALGIDVAIERCPHVPQVAVFDTAFHHSLPPHAFHYALPKAFYSENHVRRYGFHGTSHFYVAKRAAAFLKRPLQALNLITLHLGNGASATAIQNGQSVDTSMGMTPLEGLMMGTRCGDIDPAIQSYLERSTGKSSSEIETVFNEQSGLKGVCGVNDMREVQRLAASGNCNAQLALEMYAYRIKKYIGAYCAALGPVDALVFTAGIGENSARVRELSCEGLDALGIALDPVKNNSAVRDEREIQDTKASVKVLVIPTNEEREIAEQTQACIEAARTK